jgi:putative flippase GtrA
MGTDATGAVTIMSLNTTKIRSIALQFTRFLVTGVFNTAVGLGVIWFCWRVIGLPPVVANAIGYCVGLCVSFLINRTWTFRSDRSTKSALPRFLAVFVVSYLANLATLLLLTDVFHVRVEWATLAANVPYTLVFYCGSRWFVFRPSTPGGRTETWKSPQRVLP